MKLKKLPYTLTVCKLETVEQIDLNAGFYFIGRTDEELYEGTRAGWKEMFLETMFPSADTLNRCGVMKDFGDGKNAVTNMWAAIQ